MASNQLTSTEQQPQDRKNGKTSQPTVIENQPNTGERAPGPVGIEKSEGTNVTFDLNTLEGINGGGDLG
jgi:hypothetical protein